MKTKTPSFLSQAARLLLITCATLASCLFSLGTASAQSTDNKIINNNLVSTGTAIKFGTTDQTIYYSIPTDAHYVISGTPTITTSLTVDTLSFDANSTLTVDGTLTVKNISSDAPNTTMILDPNAVVDLGGSTLTVSSLTLADNTEIINGTYSFNDGDNTLSPVPADLIDTIPSYKLSNGAKLIHGTLIIDSTQSDALHLVESSIEIAGTSSVTLTEGNTGYYAYTGGTLITDGEITLATGVNVITGTVGNNEYSNTQLAGTTIVSATLTGGNTGSSSLADGTVTIIGTGTSTQQ